MPSTYGPVAVNHVTGALEYAASVGTDQIADASIGNADIATNAAIAESKLSLTAATGAHQARHALGGADQLNHKNFKTARRTSANLNLTSTTWANLDTGLDLTVPAAAGDVIEASMSAMVEAEDIYAQFDVVTLVSGSPVNAFSSATGTPATDGVPAWFCFHAQFSSLSGPAQYTLVAGDISAATVTCRLRYKVNAGTGKTLYANANSQLSWCLKNLGPPAV